MCTSARGRAIPHSNTSINALIPTQDLPPGASSALLRIGNDLLGDVDLVVMRQLQARRKLAGRVSWAGIRAFAFLERDADEERVPRGQDGLGGHRITKARPVDARLRFGRLGHRRRRTREGLGEDGLRCVFGGSALLRDRGGALLGRRGLGVDGGGLGHDG